MTTIDTTRNRAPRTMPVRITRMEQLRAPHPRAFVATLSVEVMKEALEQHDNYRKVTALRVKRYRRAIAESRWRLNGETVIFYYDGELSDGQHRLIAAVQEGVPLTTFVAVGIDRDQEVGLSMNRGQSRSFAQDLAARGVKSSNNTAAAVRTAMCLTHTDRPAAPWAQFDDIELSEFFAEHRGLFLEFVPLANTHRAVIPSPGRFAGVFVRMAMINRRLARAFVEGLAKGINLGPEDVVLVLRARLQKERAKPRTQRVPATELIPLVIKAWNHWRHGTTVSKLSYTSSGPHAEPYPVIE